MFCLPKTAWPPTWETLRRSLQHRLEVARASGNEKLVHQLEAEAAYLHLQ